MRIELATSSLPRKCSTTELQRLFEWQIVYLNGVTILFFGIEYKSYIVFCIRLKEERKTRLEPATYSLEGCRSTN